MISPSASTTFGIDELEEVLAGIFVIGIEHDYPMRFADLGRGETNARRGIHGLHHAVDQGGELAVDIADRIGPLLEGRIGKLADFQKRHGESRSKVIRAPAARKACESSANRVLTT